MNTHRVYRIFGDRGVLLYVGCTSRGELRIHEHRTKPWWPEVVSWTFTGALDKYDALMLETAITEAEEPRYSLSGRDVGKLAAEGRRLSLNRAHDAGRICADGRCRRCASARALRRIALGMDPQPVDAQAQPA